MSGRTTWSKEQDADLLKMIAEGLTAAQASRRAKRSRHAMIGRAYRLGVHFGDTLDPAAKARHDDTIRKSQSRPKKISTVPTPVKAPPPPSKEKPEIPPPIGALCQFPDDHPARPRTCRYIYGDPSTRDWRLCGHRTKPGTPYCLGHNAVTMEPEKRNRAVHKKLLSRGQMQMVFT